MKPVIVISAERLFMKSGALILVNDCLKFLSENLSQQFEIKALVFKKELYPDIKNVTFIEYPNARRHFLLRLYYEYFQFKKVSTKYHPYLWLSLQDSTPSVNAAIRAVYIHNPALMGKLKLKYLFRQPSYFAYHTLAKYIYPLFIRKNNHIIVQQAMLGNFLAKKYKVSHDKFIIAPPELSNTDYSPLVENKTSDTFLFLYPATAFVYKNHDTVIKAVRLLANKGINNIEILFTISGNENKYARSLRAKAEGLKITFINFVSKKEMYELYERSDCLLFPSLAESWGLPLREFQAFNKSILAADVLYANETIGDYNKVAYFPPSDYRKLATLMEDAIKKQLAYQKKSKTPATLMTTANGWDEVFRILLNSNK
ncbi:glycosyltransferase [Niabella ginsengisoli]|uniref:Glycosyltransferase n=1 Tax=Niabella ginsengisoli TaxID=522298 RepID=A0ABS9SQI0_9BACT|nr:glycosyltransferase [Niabella ginsengisoli]MCH5600622.1 glycosyltransferase [Niabella ginsengisoli]